MSSTLRHIFLVNQTNGLVSPSEMQTIAQAYQDECDEVLCSAHRIRPVRIIASDKVSPGGEPLVFYDKLPQGEQDGTLGEHWEEQGVVRGAVFVEEELKYGGGVLTVPSHAPEQATTVAATGMHELAELLLNPTTTCWWDGPITVHGKTYAQVASEIADPVEGTLIARAVAGTTVEISDYILPDWYDPEAPSRTAPAPVYNRARTLKAPFTMGPASYVIVRDGIGKEQAVFDDRMPAHRRARRERMLKYKLARLARACASTLPAPPSSEEKR